MNGNVLKNNVYALTALLLFASCGSSEKGTVEANGKVSHCIAPLSSGIDVNNLQDCTVAASFSADDFRWMGGNLCVNIYTEDLYDAVEVANLQPGDTIVYQSEPLIVSAKKELNNGIEINGGVENGGCLLESEDGGTYSARLMDDHSVYTLLGKKEIPLSDSFMLIDCGEQPDDPVDTIRTNQKRYIENLPAHRQNFMPVNTKIVIENGVIKSIARRWIP